MKIKVEDLGGKYRISELAYTEPLRWPESGKEFMVNYANMKFILNEKQLDALDKGEFSFNIPSNRIGHIYRIFGNDPNGFAELDVEEMQQRLEAVEEKQKEVEAKLAKINDAVDGMALTPKF